MEIADRVTHRRMHQHVAVGTAGQHQLVGDVVQILDACDLDRADHQHCQEHG
jgi:hypothetical protein